MKLRQEWCEKIERLPGRAAPPVEFATLPYLQMHKQLIRVLCGNRFGLGCGLMIAALASHSLFAAEPPSATPVYGGSQEVGFVVGYSPAGGPIWGYQQNVRYSPTIARYSVQLTPDVGLGCRCALRYSPEITALSIMHENAPSSTNPAAPITHYGAGVSPVGFQLDFRRGRRVQPLFTTDAGFIYYNGRVLSPQGSQFMYTIDFGGGVELFTSGHNAVVLGYRYQHLSNANISDHNPGTDADTFYVGFSHFHSRH